MSTIATRTTQLRRRASPRAIRARRLRGLTLLGLLAFPLAGSCAAGNDSASNESFEDWCGVSPCDWRVDQGSVAQVATWHSKDFAVLFRGPGNSQISQRQDSFAAPCMRFDVVSKHDRNATLTLHLDFNEDGKIDWSQSLADLSWQNAPFRIPTPTVYDGVRFIVLKEGDGTALVAQVVVSGADECPNFPLRLEAGSSCEDDSVCADGPCVDSICQAEAVRQPTESE